MKSRRELFSDKKVTTNPHSLCRRCNLTPVNNTCEAAPRSLFWAPNRLNKSLEVHIIFPFDPIGKPEMGFLTGQSWCVLINTGKEAGGLEQGFLSSLHCNDSSKSKS